MSLKSRLIAGFTAITAIGIFAVATSAQDTTAPKEGEKRIEKRERGMKRGGFEKGMRGHHGGGFGLRGIDLTDAQKEQIRQIREANRPDKAVMEEMRTIMQAKRAGTITAEQEARLQVLRTQSREKGESIRSQIQAVLTAEQKAQIEKRKQEIKQRMEERRQLRQKRTEPTKTT